MEDDADDLVTQIHREAWERFRQQPPPPPPEPPTIHYTELPAAKPGWVLEEEWETYRREVGRLLAEGNEGRYIVIKGQQIIGIWDRREDAQATAYQKFLLQPFLLQRIQDARTLTARDLTPTMARLTFPIQQNELKLAAVINLNHPAMTALVAAGQPVPAPVWARGIVDTGSSITCVTAAVVQKLGITEIATTRTQTAGGSVPVRLYEVSLSIPPAGNLPGPMLTRSDLLVMELLDPIPDVEVLIGLDILLDCRLLVDGPGRQFTLNF